MSTQTSGLAIETAGLVKTFGETRAVDGVDLAVPAGTVYGVLGPNGAGKTTTVKMLATLLRPDSGQAHVFGRDVVREADEVRSRVSLTGQYASVDEDLTGTENLTLLGRLLGHGKKASLERSEQLLAAFGLTDAAAKQVKHYSGGMRRRIDIAASILNTPDLLFLDEPTTGLDPRSRNQVWDIVRAVVAQGTTVLLTTQYLEEADKLASRITVIDQGRAIADDTPDGLKNLVGGDRVEVVVTERAEIPRVVKVVARVCDGEPETDEEALRVHAPVTDRVSALTEVARTLQDEGVGVEDIGLRRPSLDDVFLRLTGHRTEKEAVA